MYTNSLAKEEKALGPAIIPVFHWTPCWTDRKGNVKGWKVIIEHEGVLLWAFCYDESMLKNGYQEVEITRNSHYELMIKKG